MERQNAKIRKKYDDAERKRILKLIDAAEKFDPRIKAEREEKERKKREEKERREQEKLERELAKKRAEDEKKAQAEKEQKEKEEKERLEREARKKKQQEAKSLRQRLKKSVQAKCTNLDKLLFDDFQQFCVGLEAEALEALCQRFESMKDSKQVEEAVLSELKAEGARKDDEARAKEEQKKAEEEEKQRKAEEESSAAVGSREWRREELGLLAKGLSKYPGGTQNRWKCIKEFLQQEGGFTRTEKEVVTKAKEQNDSSQLKSMSSKLNSDSVSAMMADNKGAKLEARETKLEQTLKTAEASSAAGKTEAFSPPARKAVDASPKSAAAAAPKSAAASGSSEADWTPEQQSALENALRKYPGTMDKNERWNKIAEDVPGKTRKDCVARFKFLSDALKAGKK